MINLEFRYLTSKIKVYVNGLNNGHWYWTERTELYNIEENGEHKKYQSDVWFTKGFYKFVGQFKHNKVFIISVAKFDFETREILSPKIYGSSNMRDVDFDFETDYVKIEAIIV